MRRQLVSLLVVLCAAACTTDREPPALTGQPVYEPAASADHLRQRHVTTTTTTAPPKTTTTTAPPQKAVTVRDDVWWALFGCESGGTYNPAIVSKTGKFRGAFQFDFPSWYAAGGTGDPITRSYDEQKEVAIRWMQMNGGFSPWPHCSRVLGLPR